MHFKNITQFIFNDVRRLCFFLAIILYSFWGSPTPDSPSVLEMLIAVLLVLAIGFKDVILDIISSFSNKSEKWLISITVLFIYGFSVSCVLAVVNNAPILAVMRDIVGFIFLCLPLFVVPFIQSRLKSLNIFLVLIFLIGFVFALRVIFPAFMFWPSSVALLYLANSPLVLLTTLFFLSYGFLKLFQKISIKNILLLFLSIFLSSIPLLAMFVDFQRASVVAIGVTIFCLFILGLIRAPLKMIAPAIFFVGLTLFIYPFLADIIESFHIKTSQVGLNMRLQEVYALWDTMRASWMTILFGQGWGASFASPAVGELHVTYTHSLLTYVFFKMGIAGLFLTLIYLFFVFEKLVSLYFSDPLKGNALMWPLLIPIFLYASHKSFDFGLLLSAIIVSAPSRMRSDQREVCT